MKTELLDLDSLERLISRHTGTTGNPGSIDEPEHPLARAIVDFARADNIALPEADSFQYEPGLGVTAFVGGDAVIQPSTEILGS